MDLELRGKRALVTGASRGIGKAIAETLLEEGVKRVVIVSSDKPNIDRARGDLLAKYPRAEVNAVAADLKKHQNILAIVDQFPDIDILINNAGAIPHGTLTSLSDEAWLDGWQLKVFGAVRLSRGFYGAMAKRGSGVIVNVIGNAGERVLPSYVAGSAGNAALIAFTKAVGAESAQDNIRVVGVNPGPILTERLKKRLVDRAASELGDAERWHEFASIYPFGRFGSPREIAEMVAFLASPRAAYVSGTIITVDGGIANRPPAT